MSIEPAFGHWPAGDAARAFAAGQLAAIILIIFASIGTTLTATAQRHRQFNAGVMEARPRDE